VLYSDIDFCIFIIPVLILYNLISLSVNFILFVVYDRIYLACLLFCSDSE
jgi:hypothetical protein